MSLSMCSVIFLIILEKLFNDDRAIELPINIVVMLVVGMGSPL